MEKEEAMALRCRSGTKEQREREVVTERETYGEYCAESLISLFSVRM